MNKRQTKKKNKKIHKNILSNIPFEVCNDVYSNGDFLFEFGPAEICWFYLKELPKWKFGIWLTESSYEIFGQGIASIDKFKPSHSVIGTDDINEFVDDLFILLDTYKGEDTEFSEYVESDEEWIESNIKHQKINDLRLNFVKLFIHNFNDKHDDIMLKLYDRNSKNCSISPRYNITVHAESDLENVEQRIFDAYVYLQEQFDTLPLSVDDLDLYSTDSFIFDYFSVELKGRKFYEYQQQMYNWKDSYDEHIQYQFDYYCKSYDVLESDLEAFIHSLNTSAYKDADDILLAVYDRYVPTNTTYNVGYAKTLSFIQARKNRKIKEENESMGTISDNNEKGKIFS